MSRYIDADLYAADLWKLRENYQMLDDTHTADKIMHGIFRAEQTLKEQPTVDAVPVVHAYWIIKPHGTYGQLRAFCSACGKHSGIGGIVSNQKKPYCPNCGAIMDGKEIVDG